MMTGVLRRCGAGALTASVLLAAGAAGAAPPAAADGSSGAGGWLVEAGAGIGGSNAIRSSDNSGWPSLASWVSVGRRAGALEAGVAGEFATASSGLFGASATIYGAALFVGWNHPLGSGVVVRGFELRARLGGHGYNLRGGGSATFPFVGIEPRFYIQAASEHVSLLLSFGAFLETDLATSTVQSQESQGLFGPVGGPVTMGGLIYCVGPSIGVWFP